MAAVWFFTVGVAVGMILTLQIVWLAEMIVQRGTTQPRNHREPALPTERELPHRTMHDK